jgi:hypothetical protein
MDRTRDPELALVIIFPNLHLLMGGIDDGMAAKAHGSNQSEFQGASEEKVDVCDINWFETPTKNRLYPLSGSCFAPTLVTESTLG